MGLDSQSKDPRPAGVLNKGTLVVIMRILSLVREESGLAKRIRLLWSAIYWVSPRLEVTESVCWNRLKQIGIIAGTAQVQKTVLLGTARILRFLKSKATGCGSISTVIVSSITTTCVRKYIIDDSNKIFLVKR